MEQKHDFRPYDDAKAIAGNPVGCRGAGYLAKILMRDGSRIIGASTSDRPGAEWRAEEWTRTGHLRSEPTDHPRDLVMLPLCYVQGRAAYPGDTLHDANGEAFQMDEAAASQVEAAKEWTWEKPVQAIETKMTSDELLAVVSSGQTLRVEVANAAIARAIADGQVVPAESFFSTSYGTVYGPRAATKHLADLFIAGTTKRARDASLDLGAAGSIYGSQFTIDALRLQLNLPEKVAAKVIESAANLVHSKVGAGEVVTFQMLAQSIREINTARIIRKAKGE